MTSSLSTSIPDDFVLDVHDLAAIILDTHARSEPLFAQAQLVEINSGDTPLSSLPPHVLPSTWYTALSEGAKRRVAYILKSDPQSTERTTIDTFASPQGVRTPTECDLTRRELEDVFWRCKTFDSGYLLVYVAQRVFDSLPPTATLRARTSSKHEIVCKPSDVTVGEIDILAKEGCLFIGHQPRPDLGPSKVDLTQHLSGFGGSMPWAFLLLGEPKSTDLEADPRVVLDLVTSQIGGRGGGGEVFALERAFDYHTKVLSNVADEMERYVLSGKVQIREDHIRARGDALVETVVDRLRKIAKGEEGFCRYCGKDDVQSRCSKCKKAYFCQLCNALGWRYHKVWCS